MSVDEQMARAPEEIKKAAIAQHELFARLKHTEEQHQKWTNELCHVRELFNIHQREYGRLLGRWNPETNEVKGLQDCP